MTALIQRAPKVKPLLITHVNIRPMSEQKMCNVQVATGGHIVQWISPALADGVHVGLIVDQLLGHEVVACM